MKKRIGILTYNSNKVMNYGGVLQGFALNRKISELLGSDYDVINYNYSFTTTFSSTFRKIVSRIYNFLISALLSEIIRRHRTFKLYKTFLDNKKTNEKNLPEHIKSRYIFTIVGSDQVWNPRINNFDKIFALSHFDRKTAATYAASFGSSVCEIKYLEVLNENLKKFNCVSLREDSGIDILKQFNGVKRVDLDPTLLLDKSEWKEIIKTSKVNAPKRKYLFCYIMPGDNRVVNAMIKYADILSKRLGLEVIYCGQKHFSLLGKKRIYSLGPIEWIKYIEHSDFVLTNSFHGVAFSENLNKPFAYVKNPELNKSTTDLSSRIVDFLHSLNEEYRILSSTMSDIDLLKLTSVSNNINELLDARRQNSINYLKAICHEIHKR